MEVRKRSLIFVLALALAGGLAACQTGYDDPGMDAGTQTGEATSPRGDGGGGGGGGGY